MKLSSNVRRTTEVTKSLKIGTSGLEIEAKEEDYTTTDLRVLFYFPKLFNFMRKSLSSWLLQVISYNFN